MHNFAGQLHTFIKRAVYTGALTSNKIDHSDLKLENILLDKNENVKLGDFGFTREYEPKKFLETWCGTYSYAAPEMIQGERYSGEGNPPHYFFPSSFYFPPERPTGC